MVQSSRSCRISTALMVCCGVLSDLRRCAGADFGGGGGLLRGVAHPNLKHLYGRNQTVHASRFQGRKFSSSHVVSWINSDGLMLLAGQVGRQGFGFTRSMLR